MISNMALQRLQRCGTLNKSGFALKDFAEGAGFKVSLFSQAALKIETRCLLIAIDAFLTQLSHYNHKHNSFFIGILCDRPMLSTE